MPDWCILIVSLAIILCGAEAFTNSIEWLGKKLNLSEGAVGSVLAAVGTALPETLIPIIAIFVGDADKGAAIGVGAILGAPFMLGTLALFVTGVAVVVNSKMGRRTSEVQADISVMKRDMHYFLVVFSLAIISSWLPSMMKTVMAVILILSYGYYVYQTFQKDDDASEGEQEELNPLYLARKSSDPALVLVILQLIIALGLIVGGADLFVGVIERIADKMGFSPMILSLVIAPVATELPEKMNSVIWVSQKKDTLALGNISGAMVFQSSICPAIGILLTPWLIDGLTLLSSILVILSVLLIVIDIHKNNRVSAGNLILAGAFYLVFVGVLVAKVMCPELVQSLPI